MDILEFQKYCQNNSYSFSISFWDGNGLYDITIHPDFICEHYFEENVSLNDLDGFIERWEIHAKEQIEKYNNRDKSNEVKKKFYIKENP
jgi:hypothetical protein